MSSNVLEIVSGVPRSASFTAYSVICGGTSATSPLQSVSGLGTSGQVLTSNGASALPTWQAAGGSGTVTSVALSVPASSIFSVTGSPITTSGTLAILTAGTSGGIPYFSSTSQLSSSALLTASQLIIGGGAGTAPSTLAAGSQYQVLVMGATTPGYGQVNLGQSAAITGTLPVGNGGTGDATFTAYSIIAAGTTATGPFQNVSGVGTANQVLTSNGASTLPTWQTPTTATVSLNYYIGTTANGTSWSSTSSSFADGTNSGGNTLTQVAASGLTVSAAASNLAGITFTPASSSAVYLVTAITQLRPLTASDDIEIQLTDGTRQVGYAATNQTSTSATGIYPATITGVYAPATSSAVTLKIQLKSSSGTNVEFGSNLGEIATVPSIQWSIVQINASNVMNFTNPMTTAGDIIYENATPAPARLAIGSSGQILTVSGGVPIWQTSTALVSPMTTAGDIIYENATPAAARLPIGTTGQVLTVVAGEPAWSTPAASGSTLNTWSGYFPAATSWSTSNASFTDPTISGSDTLTKRTGSGLTVTAAGSNKAGITFTPSSNTAVYIITAVTNIYGGNSNYWSAQITDGTTTICTSSGVGDVGGMPVTLSSLYTPGTTSAVTVKIQLANSGSSTTTINTFGITPAIEWSIVQVAV